MKNNKFVIIVSQRNAIDYIRKCLDSIVCQKYKNYEVVIVDDCSTDGTLGEIRKTDFSIIWHASRQCSGALNTVEALQCVKPDDEDIIVLVSGDDYLYDDSVLQTLNEAYQDDTWMTYGQFIPVSGGYPPFCKPITDTRKYRHSGLWLASHPITFKKKLWDKIKDDDLRGKDGEYGHWSFDVSILYPMIEMCGLKHMKFIQKVLYVYNDMNPSCVYKINPKENLAEAGWFRNKPQYKEL